MRTWMSQPTLQLIDVAVRHGGRLVLSVPELVVEPGEVLAVMGPNGAGKTTLVQVAALLRRPDAGEVWVVGGRASRRTSRALRRRTAVVFQEPLLFDRSVLANVACGLCFRGVRRREAERRALTWLERFGIEHLAERNARALSGGEAQRASLARAFSVEPDLLLLDEPFAALDAPTRVAVVPELAARLRETGTTAVLVTHDRGEAVALADRVAVLIDGRIVQEGSIAEVAARPASPAVATILPPTAVGPPPDVLFCGMGERAGASG